MKIFLSYENCKTVNYIAAVHKYGADAEFDIKKMSECKGVIMLGGTDIDPVLYGDENHGSAGIDKIRDEHEYKVMDKALLLGLPIFGICRGIQLINVYFGGSLYQNIPSHTSADNSTIFHSVNTVSPAISSLYGERFTVNSYHHQSVKKIAPDFESILFSEDGTVEGIKSRSKNIIAFQWHPEKTENEGVDGYLILEKFFNFCDGSDTSLFSQR